MPFKSLSILNEKIINKIQPIIKHKPPIGVNGPAQDKSIVNNVFVARR